MITWAILNATHGGMKMTTEKVERVRAKLLEQFGEDILENYIQQYLSIYIVDYDTAAGLVMPEIVLMLLEELES